MTSPIKESSVCSDSTVSSLLTNYSIHSNNPYSDTLICYKDKVYSSASEALEAYIEDFDLSLTFSERSTGKICIWQSTPKKVKFPKHRAKEKHGMFLQMWCLISFALNYLNQPVGLGSLALPSRRQSECDPDSVSLATDDLLAFPADGSLPLVQHAPFKSSLQSSEWNRLSLKTSFCPYQTSALDAESGFSLQEDGKAVAHQNPHKDFSRKKHGVSTPERYHSVSSKGSSRPLSFGEKSNTFPLKNYPRWLTSQKSDLSVSGISSIPNSHYPLWLKSYNLFSERSGQNLNIRGTASPSQAFEILEKRHSVNQDSPNFLEQLGCQDARDDNLEGSCNDDSPAARFQFDNSFSRHTKKLFGEDQFELLTLKAARGLESSAEDLANNLENDGSPSTTDILGAERSWENAPGAFKPPVPVYCEDMENALPSPKADIIHKFLEDCLNDKNKENACSGGQHHRPLEDLKLMLFKLQAIQGSLSQHETAEQQEEFEKLSEKAEAELKLCDSEMIPLTNSIRKALHHLSRLKSLVEDNGDQQEQPDDGEDKQEKTPDL
ncbi:PREDICTED: lung adenoma susceptibility protein 2 [Leptosomus discolor]|uniref:lung adenoma susceptibility protein 2 n=1 Tax=Leptosomus discolor TaxID=188344 RepID=UPI000522D33F|nr:PREDICTED: lung adenoma susceptibility protein 2 [Leptosomus discolor]